MSCAILSQAGSAVHTRRRYPLAGCSQIYNCQTFSSKLPLRPQLQAEITRAPYLEASFTCSRVAHPTRQSAGGHHAIRAVSKDTPTAPGPLTPQDRWEESNEAAYALGIFLGVLGLGQLLSTQRIPLLDLPYFLLLATLTIYIASHRSTTNKSRQQISLKQGALAPLGASAALVGGYCIIKFFPQLSLQVVFNAYFGLLGTVAVAGTCQAPLRKLAKIIGQDGVKLPLPGGVLKNEDGKDLAEEGLLLSDLVALILGISAASADVWFGHASFTLNNLLACLIAADLLGLIGLNSFKTAAVLMLGLLAYDVFWVFGSPKVVGDNVMLAVATSDILTGPVRLLFPRALGGGEAKSFPFALLGLGDIAVPGLLAALALRYDTVRDRLSGSGEPAHIPASSGESQKGSDGPDVYFWACMGAYVAGLLCAFAASTLSHLGQPALLYIVPLMLGAVGATAAVQGELQQVIGYKEAPTESPFDKKKS